MGRSVSYPSNAVVAYSTFEVDPSWDCQGEWEDLVDGFRDQVAELFPSMERADKWLGREDHAVMANRHAWVGVSEYCGLVAFWIVPKDDTGHEALSERWVAQVAERFTSTFSTLNRLGTFSNGEGVFERTAA